MTKIVKISKEVKAIQWIGNNKDVMEFDDHVTADKRGLSFTNHYGEKKKIIMFDWLVNDGNVTILLTPNQFWEDYEYAEN